MARKMYPAKRASKSNPRVDRNAQYIDNILDFGSFEPNTKKGAKQKRASSRSAPQDNVTPFTKPKSLELIPRNLAQEKYIDALNDDSKAVVIAMGCAGTGKTFLATVFALQQLMAKKVQRIVIIRPVVTADGSNLGALPGNIIEKLGPYVGEVMSILKDYLGVKVVLRMLEDETISILPIAIARGRSIRDAVVLVEESQNIDVSSMKLITTRISTNTKLIINGDVKQADKGFSHENGLRDLVHRLKVKNGSPSFQVCTFGKGDIERSEVVKEALYLYDEED